MLLTDELREALRKELAEAELDAMSKESLLDMVLEQVQELSDEALIERCQNADIDFDRIIEQDTEWVGRDREGY